MPKIKAQTPPKVVTKTDVPYLSMEQIAKKAESFLNRYHPGGQTPVPIEEILELGLDFKIVVIAGLEKVLATPSYLALGDAGPIIHVDESRYNNGGTHRYSCAHEASHFILHRHLFEEISTREDYLGFINSIPPNINVRLEFQAHAMARYILMPREHFKTTINTFVENIGGIDQISSNNLGQLGQIMIDEYEVSGANALIQLEKEFPDVYEAAFKAT